MTQAVKDDFIVKSLIINPIIQGGLIQPPLYVILCKTPEDVPNFKILLDFDPLNISHILNGHFCKKKPQKN